MHQARQELNKFYPQTDATTFASSSNSILLLCPVCRGLHHIRKNEKITCVHWCPVHYCTVPPPSGDESECKQLGSGPLPLTILFSVATPPPPPQEKGWGGGADTLSPPHPNQICCSSLASFTRCFPHLRQLPSLVWFLTEPNIMTFPG